jgi:hypothetical protein
MPQIDADRSSVEKQAANSYAAYQQYKAKHGGKSKDEKKLENEVGGILNLIPAFFKIVGKSIDEIEAVAFGPHITGVMNHMVTLLESTTNWIGFIADHKSLAISEALEGVGTPIFSSLVEESMGISIGGGGGQSDAAIKTIKRAVGFCLILPYAAASLSFAGKLLLAERFPESINESLGKLGEELGINFMLGTLFENIFEQATGRPLEEAINRQVHPNRLDMMMIRALARQHHISEGTFHTKLNDLGYPDDLKEVILKLDDNQLSPSELQTAYLNGGLHEGDIETYLHHLGYSDQDVAIIKNNYITHAETGAKSVYRSAARRAFIDQHIDEGAFRGILAGIGDTQTSIDMEVSAGKLSQTTSAQHESMSTIKQMYQHGILDPAPTHKALADLGYDDGQISNLIKLWDDTTKAKSKQIPIGRILAYRAADILSVPDTVSRLVSLGYRPQDAQFLADNPRTVVQGAKATIHPSSVGAAVRDGLMDTATGLTTLKSAGLSDAEADLEMKVASFQYNKQHKKVVGQKHLSTGEIHTIVKAGLASWGWAEGYLESIGYDPVDATMLASAFAEPITPPLGAGETPYPTPGGGSGAGGTTYYNFAGTSLSGTVDSGGVPPIGTGG